MINENRLYHIFYYQGVDLGLRTELKKTTDWLSCDIDTALTQAQARVSQDPNLKGWSVMWISCYENKKFYLKYAKI
jgi:hypothetical protein